MGRMKEEAAIHDEWKRRLDFEVAEARYFAIPDELHEAKDLVKEILESNKKLSIDNYELQNKLIGLELKLTKSNSFGSQLKQHLIGFCLGIAASLIASLAGWS